MALGRSERGDGLSVLPHTVNIEIGIDRNQEAILPCSSDPAAGWAAAASGPTSATSGPTAPASGSASAAASAASAPAPTASASAPRNELDQPLGLGIFDREE